MASQAERQMVDALERLLRQGDAMGVLVRAENVLRRTPQSASMRYLRAVAMSRLGRGREAAAEIDAVRAELESPLVERAGVELARARLVGGDAAGARAAAGYALSDPEGAGIAASAALALGDMEGAWGLAAGMDGGHHESAIASAEVALAVEGDGRGERSREALERLERHAAAVGAPAWRRAELLRLMGELRARRGEDAEAWGAMRRAMKLAPAGGPAPRALMQEVGAQLAAWPVEQASRWPGAGRAPASTDERAVFIVGYPDGTGAMLARLLAGVAGVAVAVKPDALALAAVRHLGARAGVAHPVIDGPGKIGASRAADAGGMYLERACGGLSESRVVDASPLQVHQGGAIPLVLPRARVVHVRRDPVEACLAGMVSRLDPGLGFLHDPLKAAAYAHASGLLWGRWAAIMSARGTAVHEVEWSRVVGEPVEVVAELCRFMGHGAGVDGAGVERAMGPEALRPLALRTGLAGRFPGGAAAVAEVLEEVGATG